VDLNFILTFAALNFSKSQ